VTRRENREVAADQQVVGHGVRTEQLQLVTAVVRQQAVGARDERQVVEVDSDAGVGLTVVRTRQAFEVTLRFRDHVRALQAPLAVERTLEVHFETQVFALGLREADLLSGDRDRADLGLARQRIAEGDDRVLARVDDQVLVFAVPDSRAARATGAAGAVG
jgi:hypothetical protein